VSAEIALGNVTRRLHGAGEDTSAQRRVGNDGNVELGADFGDVVLEDIGRPQGQFHLDGGDGVYLCAVGT
jgi:hypothetical protein